MSDAGRINEIDWMKAVAVVTVVFIHSLRAAWDPGFSYVERLVSEVARFAVPAFLAVSGFLYYSETPIELTTIGKRLRRVLLPYALVSIAAYVYVQYFPSYSMGQPFWQSLLLASTFGPYYYVFLLTEFVLASWLLSRMPRSWTLPLFVASCLTAIVPFLWFKEGVKLSLWTLRQPTLFFCWFMLGWTAAAHKSSVLRATVVNRSRLFAAWFAVVVVWFGLDVTETLPPRLSRVSSLFLIAANIVGLYTAFRGFRRIPSWVVALSDRTYAIYLLHLFFVYTVLDGFGSARHTAVWASVAAAWVAGLLGALGVIAVVKRLAPRYSRDMIGA